jgi:biotin operon repressor
MPLIRGHHSFDDHFTQIPNAWLRDTRISLGAKGLLAQLLSHAPGWRISQESLGRDNGVGRDAIRTLINELLEAGYLSRSEDRERTEKGYLGGYSYTTQDPTAEPTLDKPTQDNPLHKNNNIKNNNLKNNERIYSDSIEIHFESFWNLYPKKTDKGAARRAFRKAAKSQDLALIVDAAGRYAEDPNLPEKQFIKNPATWLNAEAWNNGPLPKRKITDSKALEEWAND